MIILFPDIELFWLPPTPWALTPRGPPAPRAKALDLPALRGGGQAVPLVAPEEPTLGNRLRPLPWSHRRCDSREGFGGEGYSMHVSASTLKIAEASECFWYL
jgi:hypothetical protein